MKDAGTHTIRDFYEAPKPWGQWTQIGSHDSSPEGYYSPEICPKFQTENKIFVLTAGYWKNTEVYRLTVIPLELSACGCPVYSPNLKTQYLTIMKGETFRPAG